VKKHLQIEEELHFIEVLVATENLNLLNVLIKEIMEILKVIRDLISY
jgi:hypothetical protein